MYEATVSVPESDEYLLAHVKKLTSAALAEIDGISTDMTDKHRCYLSVACSDTFRFQLKRLVTESVAETVALGYKNIFVRNFLKVSGNSFFENVLVNTMCVFDKAYDQQIISKIVDADKPVYIDGYYNFKLDALKRKWAEIAKLVTENNYILRDKQLIIEFLQYLLESVNSKTCDLTLSFEKDGFLLYDGQGNLLPQVSSLAARSSVEEEAALNVLLLKPRRLTVYSATPPDKDFCTLMRLFDCKYQTVK